MSYKTEDSKLYAILMGLVINIFVAGMAWGTLWTKVENIEKRLDRYDEDSRTYNDTPRLFGPSEVSAAPLQTPGELRNE
jgi:hypothetical protein